jgi:hypothetical protein
MSQWNLLLDDVESSPRSPLRQPVPGVTDKMSPRPDHGEDSYKGAGRLKDKKVLITGADSGIGRAVSDRLCARGR